MWLIYTIALLIILCLVLFSSRLIKHQIGLQFKILISCLLELDKGLYIEYESNASIILFTSNNRGSITIFLIENYGLVYVTIESVNTDNYIEKKEWFFLEEMNQYLIFDEIITSFFKEYNSYVFSPKKIKQCIHKTTEKTKNIKLKPVFTKHNLPQSSFFLVFKSISILTKNKNVSNQCKFEILFFGCLVSYNTITKSKKDVLWEDYIILLMHYLDCLSLTKQIECLLLYFENRIELYTKQLKFIKENNNPDYDVLYHYFFEKPFSSKFKIKPKDWDKNNFIKLLNDLIKDIEDKTVQLDLLAS